MEELKDIWLEFYRASEFFHWYNTTVKMYEYVTLIDVKDLLERMTSRRFKKSFTDDLVGWDKTLSFAGMFGEVKATKDNVICKLTLPEVKELGT